MNDAYTLLYDKLSMRQDCTVKRFALHLKRLEHACAIGLEALEKSARPASVIDGVSAQIAAISTAINLDIGTYYNTESVIETLWDIS